jgi:hypothetical protein
MSRVLSLVPVVERVAPDRGPFALWPVAPRDHAADRWLPVSGSMTPQEVGTAVYGFLAHSHLGQQGPMPPTAPAALAALIGLDTFYSPGGLLLRDGTWSGGAPGCCCDLFEWRDWLGALAGVPVDLGHGPAPWIEYDGDLIRVWSASAGDRTGDDAGPAERIEPHFDIHRDALPELLYGVQRDLLGFLDVVRAWAERIDPGRADALVAAFDIGLTISEPLAV